MGWDRVACPKHPDDGFHDVECGWCHADACVASRDKRIKELKAERNKRFEEWEVAETARINAEAEVERLQGQLTEACDLLHDVPSYAGCDAWYQRKTKLLQAAKAAEGGERRDVSESVEQRCRDLLELCGIENAQSMTAGDLCPLANEIVKLRRLKALEDAVQKYIALKMRPVAWTAVEAEWQKVVAQATQLAANAAEGKADG